MAVMIAVARDHVDPPSQYQPGLPADLERVVALGCSAKSPADRYSDADRFDQGPRRLRRRGGVAVAQPPGGISHYR